MNYVALVVFILTYAMIAARGVRNFSVPPWASMALGGTLMIITGVVSPGRAFQAVDLNVIFFLIALFSFSSALEVSGFLRHVASLIVSKAKSTRSLILYTVLVSGVLSNFVTNDGVSSSWTPVVIESAKLANLSEKPLLYALAFGVTVGSVMMPTGNPQNLLIALGSGVKDPFITFVEFLALPTLINLVLTYYLLLAFFRDAKPLDRVTVYPIQDKGLAYTAVSLLGFTVVMYFITEALSLQNLNPVVISMLTSSILYILSEKRREVVRRVDWSTIVFFAFLFIFTQGVLDSGVFGLVTKVFPVSRSVLSVILISVVLSQLISNVPMVAIYIPLLNAIGPVPTVDWLALAAGSTIAGNLTLLGAASNIIISEASETRGGTPLYFLEFIKYGAPLTLVNVIVYYAFLKLI